MLECPTRSNAAPAGYDSWQDEWNATYAELVGVLAAIEDGLDELTERPTFPRLKICTIDETADDI